MRSPHTKLQKGNIKCKINKKKRTKKSTLNMRNDLGMENLEHINEAIRIHKSDRGDGKGSWKLVPKDSCEVYKDRRRRQMANRKHESEEGSFSEESYWERDPKTSKKVQKKVKKKQRGSAKKVQPKRRARRCPSLPSYTGSSTSATTSFASTTDMDEY